MKMDFLRILKSVLYVVSFAEIFLFGYLADKTGSNMKMMIIALILLALNIAIYKAVEKYRKNRENENEL